MVRIRHGWLVVALGLGLSMSAASGCKKDDKKSDPATGDKTSAGSKMAGGATASSDDLSLLPLDSELVLGINVAQVQQSVLWKQFVEPKMMSSGEAMKKMSEFKAKCGFDPMTAVKSVSIGMKGLANEKPDGVIVVHGMDKTKTWACLDTMKDEIEKDGTEFTKTGDIAFFKNPKVNQTYAVSFVNDSTMIAVLGDQATADGVKAVAAGKSTLKTSPQFLDMYSKVSTNDSLWGLMNGASKAFDKMGSIGVKPKAVFGSLNVTDGLAVDFRMRLDTPDAAAQLANMAKGQLQQVAKMVDKADVTNDGADAHFVIALSSQKLQQLIQQFSGLFGAFSGSDKMGNP
jgi:hypothetical protein